MKETIVVFIWLLAVVPCEARIITVDDDGPADFNNIQAAINDANVSDVVIVQPGTYTGSGNRDIDFLGKAITVRSTEPNDPAVVAATVIDCNGTESEPHNGLYFGNYESGDSVLEGVTIANGYALGGGGIYCRESSPTIAKCVISRCRARRGGGIYMGYSSPTLTDCTFSENASSDPGSSGYGGAMYNFGNSSPTVYNCTFTANMSASFGGAVYNYARGVEESASPTFVGCTFRENSAEYGGAVANCLQSEPNLLDCYMTRNRAASSGGAVYQRQSSATLVNCQLSENIAGEYGGGVAATESSVRLVNCTLAGNSAPNGLSLACDSESQCCPSTLEAVNCILWDANAVYNADGSAITITCSDVQGGYTGEGNIDADPCFAFAIDYRLMADSPCIDAGTNAAVGLPQTDIDGDPRVLDGDGNATAVADMGVHEFNPSNPWIAVSAVSFSYIKDITTHERTLQIRNCGGGSLNWEIAEDCNWLSVSPGGGVSTSDIDEVALIADANGLPCGPHNYTMKVVDPNAANNPVSIEVSLYVGCTLHVPAEYSRIQQAIDASEDGDTVLLADGTYTGEGNRDIDFLGKAITVRSVGPNDPNTVAATIIDCNGTEAEHHHGFHFNNGEDTNSVLNGLTITNGNSYYGGAGVYCQESGPTVTRCVIRGNVSEDGAAVRCDSSSAVITNCVVTGNIGYGIWCSGSATIADCIVSENTNAGMGCWNGTTITNCAITGNAGDGVYCGGVIVDKCTISGNERAGVVCYDDTTIQNCLISENRGCGVNVHGDNSEIVNTIIAGNKGAGGGGISCWYQLNVRVNECTIVANSGEQTGGALYCRGSMMLNNCILRGNTSPSGPEICVSGTGTLSTSYDNIQGGEAAVVVDSYGTVDWGIGNIDADPCFVEAGQWVDSNDPNIMVEPNDPNAVWIDGDYHLKSEGWYWNTDANEWAWEEVTSRCIDAGNPGSPLGDEALTLEVDPLNRFGQNLRMNMGAYGGTAEASMPPYDWALLADLNNDGTVNFVDVGHYIQYWLGADSELAADLDRDGMVDLGDYALLGRDYFLQTSWHE